MRRRTSILALILTSAVPFARGDDLLPPKEIPFEGAVPGMVAPAMLDSVTAMALAADRGPYRRQLRALARRYFGNHRNPELRQQGIDMLIEFTDSGALFALPFALDREKEDVRTAMLDHLANSGPVARAALAWAAVHHDDPSMRTDATRRLIGNTEPLVLAVIEAGLRDTRHAVVNAAGAVAGAIGAAQAIPLLIFSQYSEDRIEKKGDLAWIAIGTQQSYVQNLIPITGNGSGAFQPVIGTITEGFVLRVSDAVAIVYRTEVHVALEHLSTAAAGQSTAALGWDLNRWRTWYNQTYLPILHARAGDAELARKAEAIARREAARK